MSVSPDVESARLDAPSEAMPALWACLSKAERARALRFRFAPQRRRFVVARARLRQMLGRRLSAAPETLEFSYGGKGKPALAGHCAASGLKFNVAHCADLAVYAFAQGRAVGVDVEALRDLPDAGDIADRYFSRREAEALRALPGPLRVLGFLNCWTRKEALLKALGCGLSMPLDAFDVSLAPGAAAEVLRIGTQPGDGGWRLHSFVPQAGFIAAAAVKG